MSGCLRHSFTKFARPTPIRVNFPRFDRAKLVSLGTAGDFFVGISCTTTTYLFESPGLSGIFWGMPKVRIISHDK